MVAITDADVTKLKQALSSNNAVGLADFCTKIRPMIKEKARRYSRDAHEADDITQNTMIKILGAIGQVRLDSANGLRNWLITTTRNAAVDFSREMKRVRRKSVDDVDLDQVIDPKNPVDELTRMAKKKESLLDYTKGLISDDHWEVFRLGVIEDRPYKEVAEMMNIPEGTVKTRIHSVKRLIVEYANQENSVFRDRFL